MSCAAAVIAWRFLPAVLSLPALGLLLLAPVKCCVDAVREMLPSDTFMGFMEVQKFLCASVGCLADGCP